MHQKIMRMHHSLPPERSKGGFHIRHLSKHFTKIDSCRHFTVRVLPVRMVPSSFRPLALLFLATSFVLETCAGNEHVDYSSSSSAAALIHRQTQEESLCPLDGSETEFYMDDAVMLLDVTGRPGEFDLVQEEALLSLVEPFCESTADFSTYYWTNATLVDVVVEDVPSDDLFANATQNFTVAIQITVVSNLPKNNETDSILFREDGGDNQTACDCALPTSEDMLLRLQSVVDEGSLLPSLDAVLNVREAVPPVDETTEAPSASVPVSDSPSESPSVPLSAAPSASPTPACLENIDDLGFGIGDLVYSGLVERNCREEKLITQSCPSTDGADIIVRTFEGDGKCYRIKLQCCWDGTITVKKGCGQECVGSSVGLDSRDVFDTAVCDTCEGFEEIVDNQGVITTACTEDVTTTKSVVIDFQTEKDVTYYVYIDEGEVDQKCFPAPPV